MNLAARMYNIYIYQPEIYFGLDWSRATWNCGEVAGGLGHSGTRQSTEQETPATAYQQRSVRPASSLPHCVHVT